MATVRITGDIADTRQAVALHCSLLAKREEMTETKDDKCLVDLCGTGLVCDDAKRVIGGFVEWARFRTACLTVVRLI